tara:strand:- start:1145 stop:1444 length:300 start_codon:yes stop_codon:yes gene_type:complete
MAFSSFSFSDTCLPRRLGFSLVGFWRTCHRYFSHFNSGRGQFLCYRATTYEMGKATIMISARSLNGRDSMAMLRALAANNFINATLLIDIDARGSSSYY